MSVPFPDLLPPAMVGGAFTLVDALKLYGLRRGIVGGARVSFTQKLCGTRPTWKSRSLRLGFPLLFLAIGLGNLPDTERYVRRLRKGNLFY